MHTALLRSITEHRIKLVQRRERMMVEEAAAREQTKLHAAEIQQATLAHQPEATDESSSEDNRGKHPTSAATDVAADTRKHASKDSDGATAAGAGAGGAAAAVRTGGAGKAKGSKSKGKGKGTGGKSARTKR